MIGQKQLNYPSPLVFMRHGVTDWNLEGRYQGSTDTQLSATGVDQVNKTVKLVHGLIGNNCLDAGSISIESSPLKRARETADILTSTLDAVPPVRINPGFRELSIGRWEGLTSQQVKDQFYTERKSRKTDRWNFQPVGGESMASRCPDINAAIASLQSHTIVVTHAVVLRIIVHLLGGESQESAAVAETPHTEIWCWNGVKLHRQALKT